jgi:hypothetical protein
MAGWSISVGPVGIWSLGGPDDAEKARFFPVPAGSGVQYMPELIWKLMGELAANLQRLGGGSPGIPGQINNLQWSANNGAGDSGGIGTFTITFTTS